MGFKLPPLSSLRVFEAAARRGSFKNAAEELNITASAVSHAVQNLEDWLGVELFRRGGGKLELTEPGAAYASAIGKAIKAIADATARLPGRRSRGRLTLSSAPGFAARWLMPRLSRFADRHPEISVDIQTSLDPVDLPMEGIDAAIRLARRRGRCRTGRICWQSRSSLSARRRYGKSTPSFPAWNSSPRQTSFT
jgi:LysR family glycine cleavage system transcriptional activator